MNQPIWHVGAGVKANELIVEASLDGWKSKFMSATTLTKHRGDAKKHGGAGAADFYIKYVSTVEVGGAMEQHRPGSLAWLEERAPWHAEPLYDNLKRGQVIIEGKARLILRDKDTALLFKLTWG